MREERMRVLGLHCQPCLGSVERRVEALPGVHAVLVHAQKKQVIVVYEEARCDRGRIEWVIYDEGYDVVPTPRSSGRPTFQRLRTAGDAEDPSGRPTTTISW